VVVEPLPELVETRGLRIIFKDIIFPQCPCHKKKDCAPYFSDTAVKKVIALFLWVGRILNK
jgi:hypothetical protein